MTLPRLLVLTDRTQLPAGRDLVSTLRACPGDFAVVLREFDLPWPERERLAAQIAEFAPVIAARELLRAATGIHLSANQAMPRPEACGTGGSRDAVGSSTDGVPWGRSCHSLDDVRRAAAEGASWVNLGPVAPTLSKPGYAVTLTPAEITAAADLIPVYGLGGVTPDNAKSLLQLGIQGLAVMGRVMRADDPAGEVAALEAAL